MHLPRQVQPEWLDLLPGDDPCALRARRDLRRLNGWMMQPGIMERLLTRHSPDRNPRAILELGAGDGTFMLRLARRLAARWQGVRVILLDRQAIVSDETRDGFRGLGWRLETVTADVFEFLDHRAESSVDIITANLLLHHFTCGRVKRLFAHAALLAPLFVACEPRRAVPGLICSRLLWTIGCNAVTRHDAAVSVRAGFAATELWQLWPEHGRWQLHEHPAGLFTHCFVARHVE
jgi:SAM-dependent methyltransferase